MAITISASAPTGIPISGNLGPNYGSTQGGSNTAQNTATTGNQYNGGSILNAVNGGNTSTASTGGTSGTVTSAPSAAATTEYNNEKASTLAGINDLVTGNATDYGGSIQDYLDSRAQSQNSINNDAVQAELAREQGQQGILNMVSNGIKSGGVTLGNANAGSSSAADAIARAYSTLGRQQASSVGNQFAQANGKVQTEENNLLAGDTTEARHVTQSKTDTINNIVNSARQQLADLNYYASNSGVTDRVDIENQISQVKQQAIDALSTYDSQLASGTSKQPINTADQTRTAAQGLLTAGVAPENSYDYTTNVPTQLQGTGQFASSLPIFVSPNKNNDNT